MFCALRFIILSVMEQCCLTDTALQEVEVIFTVVVLLRFPIIPPLFILFAISVANASVQLPVKMS